MKLLCLIRMALVFALAFGPALFLQAQDVTEAPAAQQQEAKAEEEKPKSYEFTIEHTLDRTDIKSQDATGTCWCFATASFIESELMREGKGEFDLSEMFIVKNIYKDKASNYVLRHGKANFGEGALAHDFINAANRHGMVPESVYTGLQPGEERHNHGEMSAVLKGMLDALIGQRRVSDQWDEAYSAVLDTYLGASPEQFSIDGQQFTPQSFAQHLGFDGKNYLNFTSYSHHPFGEPFVLEIPDNFSNGSFHNVPIDRLVAIIDHAVANGYSVAWDGDVSERGFSRSKGLAILPKDANRSDALTVPGEEIEVDQAMRQKTFEEYSTTDDHLMHLVGIATDQNGTKYYVIKNSWGKTGPYDGYIYMSEAYLRLKTVAILVHKDGVPPDDDAETPTSKKADQTAAR